MLKAAAPAVTAQLRKLRGRAAARAARPRAATACSGAQWRTLCSLCAAEDVDTTIAAAYLRHVHGDKMAATACETLLQRSKRGGCAAPQQTAQRGLAPRGHARKALPWPQRGPSPTRPRCIHASRSQIFGRALPPRVEVSCACCGRMRRRRAARARTCRDAKANFSGRVGGARGGTRRLPALPLGSTFRMTWLARRHRRGMAKFLSLHGFCASFSLPQNCTPRQPEEGRK